MATTTNKTEPKTYTVKDLALIKSKANGKPASDTAKQVRALLRKNFETIVKMQPSLAKVKESGNDGNRWPAINEDVARELKLVK